MRDFLWYLVQFYLLKSTTFLEVAFFLVHTLLPAMQPTTTDFSFLSLMLNTNDVSLYYLFSLGIFIVSSVDSTMAEQCGVPWENAASGRVNTRHNGAKVSQGLFKRQAAALYLTLFFFCGQRILPTSNALSKNCCIYHQVSYLSVKSQNWVISAKSFQFSAKKKKMCYPSSCLHVTRLLTQLYRQLQNCLQAKWLHRFCIQIHLF